MSTFGTDYGISDQNFAASSGSNFSGNNFLPEIYSKKVLNFFRKASVVEAITNTDYAGEISGYGDTVKIKQPSLIQKLLLLLT
jgi:hypothetical protein